jgi:hypothetical protein
MIKVQCIVLNNTDALERYEFYTIKVPKFTLEHCVEQYFQKLGYVSKYTPELNTSQVLSIIGSEPVDQFTVLFVKQAHV